MRSPSCIIINHRMRVLQGSAVRKLTQIDTSTHIYNNCTMCFVTRQVKALVASDATLMHVSELLTVAGGFPGKPDPATRSHCVRCHKSFDENYASGCKVEHGEWEGEPEYRETFTGHGELRL